MQYQCMFVLRLCVVCVYVRAWVVYKVTDDNLYIHMVHVIQNGSCASIEIRDPDVPVPTHNSTGKCSCFYY